MPRAVAPSLLPRTGCRLVGLCRSVQVGQRAVEHTRNNNSELPVRILCNHISLALTCHGELVQGLFQVTIFLFFSFFCFLFLVEGGVLYAMSGSLFCQVERRGV